MDTEKCYRRNSNKAEKDTKSSDTLNFHSNSQFTSSFKTMADMLGRKELCDVTFIVGNEKIYAHRVILSSTSPYFNAMFTGDMIESKNEEVIIKGIDPTIFSNLIYFAYTSNIAVTEDNVQLLLPAASILQFEEVRTVCSNFMQRRLNVDNCLGVKVFAEMHGCKELESAASMFSQSHFIQVCQSDEFLQFNLEQVKEMLSKDQLNVCSEFEVFQAVVRWVDQDRSARQKHVAEMLELVRLPLLTPQELLQEVGKHSLVLGEPRCVEMVLEAVQFHIIPKPLAQVEQSRPLPRSSPKRLYAIGGWDGATAIEIVEYYDTESGKWETAACTLAPRNGVSLAVLHDKLYAIGGHNGNKFQQSVEVFDPRSKSWAYTAPLKHRRASSGVATHKGHLYAIGGQDSNVRLKSVERYDADTNSWQCVANMNMRRDSPGVVSHGDYVYAIGGCHSCTFLDTVERFDPQLNQWVSMKHMANRRSAVGAVSLGDFIYVFGGHDVENNLSVLERYNPETDEWTTLSPMNSPRAGCGGAVLDGKIVAIGGFDGIEQLNTVEEYDVGSDCWKYVAAMKYERSYVGTVTMDRIV